MQQKKSTYLCSREGELKNSQPMESSINKFRTDRVETEKIGIMAGVINIAHFVIMG